MAQSPRENAVQRLLRWLDGAIELLVRAARWLVVPLILLLFLQWPLRDGLRHGSREANDLGQIAFALFVAVAITAATRARAHLASDALAHGYSAATRQRLARLLALLVFLPWGVFMLVASWPPLKVSLRVLESFPDTLNPGYFVVKASATLLALLVLAQALVEALRSPKAAP